MSLELPHSTSSRLSSERNRTRTRSKAVLSLVESLESASRGTHLRRGRLRMMTFRVVLALALCSTHQVIQAEPPVSGVVFVAHRGGIVPGYPENTMAAFRQAIAYGVHAIEVDLRGTKDGEIVIMHDETVDRTTNGQGKVADQTLEDLKTLDAGLGELIPTYEELLQLVSGTGVTLLLDIKESAVLDKAKVVRLTEKYGAALNVIVGPRNVEDLRAFQSLNPNLRKLGFISRVDEVEAFVQAGADIIRLWPDWIYQDPGLVDKVHQSGRPVWTTAGTAAPEELEKLIRLGVDGILSDFPALMSSLFSQMPREAGPEGH